MATYYARNVSGNWNAATSWDAVSSGGAGPAGPPVAGDTAIFDSGFTGTITLTAAAACATLTCQAGATGTLALASFALTITAGVTIVSGFNLSATAVTGRFTLNGAQTITTGGVAIPNLFIGASATYTLADALTVAGTLTVNTGFFGMAGAFDIVCDAFNWLGAGTSQLVSGQTLTVTTSMRVHQSSSTTTDALLRATTASSDAFLHYNGTPANASVAGIGFTDINCAHAIDSWNGGTLTRTTGITNRTSADFATAAQAAKILDDTTISGITGTIATRTLSPANETVAEGFYAATTLSAVDADLAAANIKSGVTIFGFAGAAVSGRPEIRGGNL